MPTLNSGAETLMRGIRSLPIEVRFAGFTSTTLALANAGWDLSMKQNMDMREHRPEMQLAMRYKPFSGPGMFAISSPLRMDYGFARELMHKSAERVYEGELMHALAKLGFDIIHMGNDVRFVVQPMRHQGLGTFADSFHPIDPRPQYVEERLSDFKFFKVASPKIQDIIVNPRDVPELLELVLKAQKPMLDGVKRRERSRENEMEMRPAQEVMAQIITLAG